MEITKIQKKARTACRGLQSLNFCCNEKTRNAANTKLLNLTRIRAIYQNFLKKSSRDPKPLNLDDSF